MKQQKDPINLNISLKNTYPIKSPSGNQIFAEGLILRKVSKFALGTPEDQILPIPIFYDIETKEIIKETLPKDLHDEFFPENNI
jgi:hypothetical protein